MTKDVVLVDNTQIHRWSGRQSKNLVERIGKVKTIANIFDHEKIDVRSIKGYKAVGMFVSKPQDTEQVLSSTLSGKGVAQDTVTAWCSKLGDLPEKFEYDEGHNVTAEKDACSGQWQGAIQVTTRPDGNHEVFYCVTGVQFKTAQKIKEYKEERKPIIGTANEKFQVTKHRWLFGNYTEEEVRTKNVVMGHDVKQVPVYYPDAVEQTLYEAVMEVQARDATLEFFEQYGAKVSQENKGSSWIPPNLESLPLEALPISGIGLLFTLCTLSVWHFLQPTPIQIVVSPDEVVELQKRRAQNLEKGSTTSDKESRSFEGVGKGMDAIKSTPAQESPDEVVELQKRRAQNLEKGSTTSDKESRSFGGVGKGMDAIKSTPAQECPDEVAELQKHRAQNLEKGSTTVDKESCSFEGVGKGMDAIKSTPAQESKLTEEPGISGTAQHMSPVANSRTVVQDCRLTDTSRRFNITVGIVHGRSDLALPKDSEKDFVDMLPITLKSGEKGDSVREIVEALYKFNPSQGFETDDHCTQIKMHPSWYPGSSGFNHIIWVPSEDAARLKFVYKSDEFQRSRREFEKQHDRRAPRLTFHGVPSTSSSNCAFSPASASIEHSQ